MGVISNFFSAGGGGTSDLTNPQLWLTNALGATTTISGLSVDTQKALSLAAYWACIRCISEDVAKLPLITYRRLKPRGKERAPDHPNYKLLHSRPNALMTSMAFREALVANTLSWGNGYAEITETERAEGPDRMNLIHPQYVEPKMNDDGVSVRYEISIPGEEKRKIESYDMVHIHGLGSNGITGFSVLTYAAESIGAGLAAQEFASSFFGNAQRPSGVIESPMEMTKDARDNLAESWAAAHAGTQNANKPAILEQGVTWKTITIPPEDAQFLETRQFQVEEVCRWFRIPPHKIAHLLRATYNNIEQQSLDYYIDTLLPWIVRIEQEIDVKLFNKSDEYFAEHLVTGILRGDQAARSQFYKEQFMVGAMSQNEIRELENMNPIENGDTHYVPLNMVRSEDAAKGNTAQQSDQDEPRQPGDNNGNEPEQRSLAGNETFLTAYMAVFQEAAERILRKEAKATARAGKRYEGKQESFKEWNDKFYAGQMASYLEVFSPLASAFLGAIGRDGGADYAIRSFATEQIAISSRMVENSFTTKTIDSLGDEWLQLRPEAMARKLIKELNNHAGHN